MDTKENYIGLTYGKLTILRDVGRDKYYNKLVEVQCDCEDKTIFIICLYRIRNGYTKSCGCLTKQNTYNALKKYNVYNLEGEYGIGYTFKGEEFYFDLEDYKKIKDISWRTDYYGYIVGWFKNKLIRLHNLIMDNIHIDHINLNKYDNRKENLREITTQQNAMNTKGHGKMSKFGLKGISWDKRSKKWLCQIRKGKDEIHRARFDNIKEAISYRIDLEKLHFGEYRYTWEENIKWEDLLEYEKELKNESEGKSYEL